MPGATEPSSASVNQPAPSVDSPAFEPLLESARRQASLPTQRYFVALEDLAGTGFSRDDFVETQIQFAYAVVAFGTPLRLLAERLPEGSARATLLANVFDEAGHGDPSCSHEATFLTLLRALGEDRASIDRRALWPAVRAFNDALLGLATHDDSIVALAALGMIEDCFAALSARLGRAIALRGFLRAEEIAHYTVHETLDHAHAEGFFAPLRAALAEAGAAHPDLSYRIEQGLGFGAYLLLRLYDELFTARKTRAFRAVAGSHGGVHRLSDSG
jgi:pyrroloquinoline-quinone synthase